MTLPPCGLRSGPNKKKHRHFFFNSSFSHTCGKKIVLVFISNLWKASSLLSYIFDINFMHSYNVHETLCLTVKIMAFVVGVFALGGANITITCIRS